MHLPHLWWEKTNEEQGEEKLLGGETVKEKQLIDERKLRLKLFGCYLVALHNDLRSKTGAGFRKPVGDMAFIKDFLNIGAYFVHMPTTGSSKYKFLKHPYFLHMYIPMTLHLLFENKRVNSLYLQTNFWLPISTLNIGHNAVYKRGIFLFNESSPLQFCLYFNYSFKQFGTQILAESCQVEV